MTSSPTLWQRAKVGSKTGFDKLWKAADKLGAPVNKLTNKLGSEAFWPTTIDKESDKAARILKSFCKDGFYAEEERQSEDGPKQKQKVVKKIPKEVIQNAKGLAIFTTMRTGLWVSGAGGSGILIGRKEDGSWSPPSGILLHTAGLGFLVGVDIYDCVVVINTYEALEGFTKIRCTLGSEISVAAGPVGAGGILETEIHARQAPIFTYLKSRGFYAGVQIDGTVIIERTDENERFYGQRIGVGDILAGKVRHPPFEVRRLLETIKSAQCDENVDESVLPGEDEKPPGDYEIETGHIFSVPDKEDPDPYGVLALEKEGMGVINADTKKRASWQEFSFNPAPSSPIHAILGSADTSRTVSRRSSWRTSAHSTASTNFPPPPKPPTSGQIQGHNSNSRDSTQEPLKRPPTLMTDMSTQTDLDDLPASPSKWSVRSGISRHSSRASMMNGRSHLQEVHENEVLDTSPERQEALTARKSSDSRRRSGESKRKSRSPVNGLSTPPITPPAQLDEPHSDEHTPADDDLEDDDEDVHIEMPTVHSVQIAQPASPKVVTSASPLKARMVSVPKRGPPPSLPPRNPHRTGRGPMVIGASPLSTPTAERTSADMTRSSTTDSEARNDSVSRVSSEKDGENLVEVDGVATKMDDVKPTDETPDETPDERPDPWAKVEETKKEAEAKSARQSLEEKRNSMPGGW